MCVCVVVVGGVGERGRVDGRVGTWWVWGTVLTNG